MDTQINLNRLSRELYRRGTHRLLGSPFLGSFTAFLTVLYLLRVAVNLYLAIDLANKGTAIDAVQIASAHLVFLSAYAVWVGSLASFRIGFALPALCFIDFAPHGRSYKTRFMRQIAFLRPMNIATAAMMLLTAFVFSIGFGNRHAVVVRALVVLVMTFMGMVFVIAVASRSHSKRSELQIVEMIYMIFLVALNPDIGSFNSRVSIFLAGIHYSFYSIGEIGSTIGLIVALALLVLVLVRFLSAMGSLFRRQLCLSPVERWYWRFLRIRTWVFLYILIAPVFISSFISPGTKRWALVLSILFGVASYLSFITQCENTLHEKWRSSLFDRGNARLIARSVLTHFSLMLIPVLVYIVAEYLRNLA